MAASFHAAAIAGRAGFASCELRGYRLARVTEIVTSAPGAVAPPGAVQHPQFDIIPRRGLPLVAVAFLALIAGIVSDKLWPLEFLHVVFGSAWTVIDLFLGLVLGPIMGRMAVPSRIDFTTKLMPKMLLIMPTVVTVTLAAGWQLGAVLGTTDSSYPHHDWVVASYIVVGAMAIIALGLLEPANVAVLVELKKPRPNPAVIEHLMKRFMYTAGILGILQVATFVIMTKIAAG